MAYTITKTNGTVLLTLTDGSVDTSTSLTLIGKNHSSYGQSLNENFVQLLENFANTAGPSAPLAGQLWFDSTPTSTRIKVFDGTIYKEVGGAIVSSTEPTTWTEGDLWLNSGTGQLYVKSQGTAPISAARLIGPVADPGLGANGTTQIRVLDDTSLAHNVLETSVNGTPMTVLSKDTFTPGSTLAGFPSIIAGLNVSSAGVVNVMSNDGLYVGEFSQTNIR